MILASMNASLAALNFVFYFELGHHPWSLIAGTISATVAVVLFAVNA